MVCQVGGHGDDGAASGAVGLEQRVGQLKRSDRREDDNGEELFLVLMHLRVVSFLTLASLR